MKLTSLTLLAMGLATGPGTAAGESFYKTPEGLFSTRPGETKSLQTMASFGPGGMGIDLIQPAFTMQIHNIEEGSPAAATWSASRSRTCRRSPPSFSSYGRPTSSPRDACGATCGPSSSRPWT